MRLQLRKRQAEAGDIVLLYGDESEALTHPYLARAWAKRNSPLDGPGDCHEGAWAVLVSIEISPAHRFI